MKHAQAALKDGGAIHAADAAVVPQPPALGGAKSLLFAEGFIERIAQAEIAQAAARSSCLEVEFLGLYPIDSGDLS